MTFEARDRDRVLRFEGRLLGESSSWRAGKDRWMEVRIFLTEAGSYVVEKIGCTVVAGEVDRCRAHVCETPEGALECLYQYDENDVRFMPSTSRNAVEEAADADAGFAAAFNVEHVA